MSKFRFSMLFAAALTIATVALPLGAASFASPHHGTTKVVDAPPPDSGDFVPTLPDAPPPDSGD